MAQKKGGAPRCPAEDAKGGLWCGFAVVAAGVRSGCARGPGAALGVWGGFLVGGCSVACPPRACSRPSSPCCRFLLLRVLVLFPVGWLCAAPGCRPAFFDSLCARYARRRILCAKWGGGRERISRFGGVGLSYVLGVLACALCSSVRRGRCRAWRGVVGCGWRVGRAAWFLAGGAG